MFAQLKLSTRLSLAFAMLVAMALALGGMAVYQMSRINAGTVDIASSWLPSVRQVGEIRSTMNQIRRAEGDHLLSADDKEMDQVEAHLGKVKDSLTEQLKHYEPLIASPEEQKGYDVFKRRRDATWRRRPGC